MDALLVNPPLPAPPPPPQFRCEYKCTRQFKKFAQPSQDSKMAPPPTLLEWANMHWFAHSLFQDIEIQEGASRLKGWHHYTTVQGKRIKTDCSSYRPISLLSVPGKVFGSVFLGRLRPLLTERRQHEQTGFTASRSTADAILMLRLHLKLHYECQRLLQVAYVDLK